MSIILSCTKNLTNIVHILPRSHCHFVRITNVHAKTLSKPKWWRCGPFVEGVEHQTTMDIIVISRPSFQSHYVIPGRITFAVMGHFPSPFFAALLLSSRLPSPFSPQVRKCVPLFRAEDGGFTSYISNPFSSYQLFWAKYPYGYLTILEFEVVICIALGLILQDTYRICTGKHVWNRI